MFVLYNFVLVHRPIQVGNSRGNIDFHHLPCCVPGRASAKNACNRYNRTCRLLWKSIYNDPQWKLKETIKPHNSSRKRSAQTGTPSLRGPSEVAPVAPILLKCWLKTRKSVLNEVTKFQISTPNRLGARIDKKQGKNPPPATNRADMYYMYVGNHMYSEFNINVPLAVRFTTVAIGMRKAESSEYRRFDSDLH